MKNLSESQLGKLDETASDYYLKQALHYIAEAHFAKVSILEREKKSHEAEVAKLVQKQQAENKIQPFLSNVQYKLYELKKTWKPEHGNTILNETYNEDLLLVAQNLEILTKNTEIINNVVKALEIVGLEKTTYKYLRANAKTKTAVTSEWYLELVNKCANLNNTRGYSKDDLTRIYHELCRMHLDYQQRKTQTEKELEVQAYKEAQSKEALQREAVLVAHACLKHGFNPLEITTRDLLDVKLQEKGLVPSKVLQDLEFELQQK